MILSHSVLQDHFYRAFVTTLFIIKTKSSVVLILAYEWLDVTMSWLSSCKEDLSLTSFSHTCNFRIGGLPTYVSHPLSRIHDDGGNYKKLEGKHNSEHLFLLSELFCDTLCNNEVLKLLGSKQ